MIGLNDALLFLEVSARPLFLPGVKTDPVTTGNRNERKRKPVVLMQLRLARHRYVVVLSEQGTALYQVSPSLTFMHQLLT